MNKSKILIFITSLFMSMQLMAGNIYLDKDQFLALDLDSQITIIKKTQEIAWQLEAIQKTSKKYSDIKKYQEAKKYAQFLIQLFIPTAHAQKNYQISEKVENICIYAGWLSYLRDNKCVKPSRLGWELKNLDLVKREKIPKEVILLLDTTIKAFEDKKLGKNNKCAKGNSRSPKIVCAPHLYGTDDNEEPFCGSAVPYNASMDCSRQVELHLAKETNEDLRAEKERQHYLKVVKGINAQQPAHESGLLSMLKTFHDVCACNGEQKIINKNYAQAMFQRRTCYSWLKQSKKIITSFKNSNECHTLRESNQETVDSFLLWLNKAEGQLNDTIESEEAHDLKILSSANPKELGNRRAAQAADQRWASFRKEQMKNNQLCQSYEPPKPVPTVYKFACQLTNEIAPENDKLGLLKINVSAQGFQADKLTALNSEDAQKLGLTLHEKNSNQFFYELIQTDEQVKEREFNIVYDSETHKCKYTPKKYIQTKLAEQCKMSQGEIVQTDEGKKTIDITLSYPKGIKMDQKMEHPFGKEVKVLSLSEASQDSTKKESPSQLVFKIAYPKNKIVLSHKSSTDSKELSCKLEIGEDKPEVNIPEGLKVEISENEDKEKSTVFEAKILGADGEELKKEDYKSIKWFAIKDKSDKEQDSDVSAEENESAGLGGDSKVADKKKDKKEKGKKSKKGEKEEEGVEITQKSDDEIEDETESGLSAEKAQDEDELGNTEIIELNKEKEEYKIYAKAVLNDGSLSEASNQLTVAALKSDKEPTPKGSPQVIPQQQGQFIKFQNRGLSGRR